MRGQGWGKVLRVIHVFLTLHLEQASRCVLCVKGTWTHPLPGVPLYPRMPGGPGLALSVTPAQGTLWA
jgi:hypothetical protein